MSWNITRYMTQSLFDFMREGGCGEKKVANQSKTPQQTTQVKVCKLEKKNASDCCTEKKNAKNQIPLLGALTVRNVLSDLRRRNNNFILICFHITPFTFF